MPMGLGRRRMNDRLMDRRNRDRDSPERKRRREEGDSHVCTAIEINFFNIVILQMLVMQCLL